MAESICICGHMEDEHGGDRPSERVCQVLACDCWEYEEAEPEEGDDD